MLSLPFSSEFTTVSETQETNLIILQNELSCYTVSRKYFEVS